MPKGKEEIMGEYLRNLAVTLMRRFGIGVADMEVGETAYGLYVRRSDAIKIQLRKMRPETLGRIAACGRPSMLDAYPDNGRWIWNANSGRELLREIACVAIVAEMANVIEEIHDAEAEARE